MKIRLKKNAAEISRKFLPNGPMAGTIVIREYQGKELEVIEVFPRTVEQPEIEYYDVYTPSRHVIAIEAELVVTKKDLLVEKIETIMKKDP